MKNVFGILAAAVCLSGILLGIAIYKAVNPNFSTLYVRPVTITEKEWSTQTYIGTDNTGNKWEFSNTTDWEIGQTIYLIMDTQNTEDITDDIIINETCTD